MIVTLEPAQKFRDDVKGVHLPYLPLLSSKMEYCNNTLNLLNYVKRA